MNKTSLKTYQTNIETYIATRECIRFKHASYWKAIPTMEAAKEKLVRDAARLQESIKKNDTENII